MATGWHSVGRWRVEGGLGSGIPKWTGWSVRGGPSGDSVILGGVRDQRGKRVQFHLRKTTYAFRERDRQQKKQHKIPSALKATVLPLKRVFQVMMRLKAGGTRSVQDSLVGCPFLRAGWKKAATTNPQLKFLFRFCYAVVCPVSFGKCVHEASNNWCFPFCSDFVCVSYRVMTGPEGETCLLRNKKSEGCHFQVASVCG